MWYLHGHSEEEITERLSFHLQHTNTKHTLTHTHTLTHIMWDVLTLIHPMQLCSVLIAGSVFLDTFFSSLMPKSNYVTTDCKLCCFSIPSKSGPSSIIGWKLTVIAKIKFSDWNYVLNCSYFNKLCLLIKHHTSENLVSKICVQFSS